MNWQAVQFWQEEGLPRVVLARETTMDEIREIKEQVTSRSKCSSMEQCALRFQADVCCPTILRIGIRIGEAAVSPAGGNTILHTEDQAVAEPGAEPVHDGIQGFVHDRAFARFD